MTDDRIALRELLEKGSDATSLHGMIGFAAQRLMELETEALTGAAHDYNERRPHTSLRMRTPSAFATARPFVRRQRAPAVSLPVAQEPEPVAALTPLVLTEAHVFP